MAEHRQQQTTAAAKVAKVKMRSVQTHEPFVFTSHVGTNTSAAANMRAARCENKHEGALAFASLQLK